MPSAPTAQLRISKTCVIVACFTLLGVLGACASKSPTDPGVSITRTGVIGDYSTLQPSPRHPDTLYEQSARLTEYTAFVIDDIRFLPTTTLRGVPIDPDTANRLAAELRAEVVAALTPRYKVVDRGGPGVARIRAAVTQVSRGRTTTDAIDVGGASVEAEIVDSVSGERLGAAVESDTLDPMHARPREDPFYDARMVFRHWAARLRLWLDDAHRGVLPPTR
ncbi:MAG: DUF3313 domain-containing protein [Phycisphaerales bacterium]|nr:DUF3313 domain-containing protein [Phycisphaerales bacterium]